MSRPKGSKNKAKINMEGVRNYQQPLQNPSYEKIKSEALGAPVSQASLESSILPQWISDVELWCKEKGFHPSELIEKLEGLEAENGRLLSEKFIGHFVEGQNKPQISPETGLPVNPSKNQKKGNEGAGNKPAELSPFLKSRQALKNGQK